MSPPSLERTGPAGGQVIVLTGPPGAGKSTVSALLADRLTPSVHLHGDDFWHYIKQGRLPPHLPEAHRQNQVVLEVLVAAAFGYAAGGYHVVYDGVVGPWSPGVRPRADPHRARRAGPGRTACRGSGGRLRSGRRVRSRRAPPR
ncbi:zeta toxin family protein [Kitasatospora sp. NPDC048722]|uniref:zeta toxin family protein n=1 Tax=Kitasatospora sp. NPDC048722 TaxID=3155639 RepID=UPI0033C9CC0C